MSATAAADPHAPTRHAAAPGHAAAHSPFGHIASPAQLLAVFGALLFFTLVTVWISRGPVDFGWTSIVIAMVVATVKALLVMLFFMHMVHERPFNVFAFAAGFLFLGLFMFFALMDSSQYWNDVETFESKSRPPVVVPPPSAVLPPAAGAPAATPPHH